MAVTWRWYEGTPPSWGGMTDTTFFDDGVPGDTSTYETASVGNTFDTQPYNEVQSVETTLWAQGYLQQSHILTGVNFSCQVGSDLDPILQSCLTPPESPPLEPFANADWAVSVWDGSAFVEVASGALAVTATTPSTQAFAVEATFAAVTTCWVILTVTFSVGVVACLGLLTGEVLISDIRPQGASTGLTCYEGSPPTDGPLVEPIPPSDEDPGAASGAVTASRDCVISAVIPPDRNCVISAILPPGKSEPFPAPAADIYMIDADGTYGVDSDQTYGIDTNG